MSERKTVFEGMIWKVVAETFEFGGESLTRQFVDHPGAVAVLALNAEDQILMISQYRHPVRQFLWEIPAGLLDVEGESLPDAAMRELHEETGYRASAMTHLIDFYTTPGGNNEMIRIFLARDLEYIGRPSEQEGEERQLQVEWIDFDDALTSVLKSEIKSPSAAVGILAAAQILKK
ncbi:MAG: NUDIX domain-containing protein [Micrococcales bacterium]